MTLTNEPSSYLVFEHVRDGKLSQVRLPLVRCHECKHCERIPLNSYGGEAVTQIYVCNLRQLSRHITDRDGWCYLAQRREDEGERP